MRTRDREQVPSSSGRRVAPLVGAALLAAWVALPVGCSDDQTCTPGAQVACACGGGEEGAQACNDDGTAFGDCDCSNISGPSGPGSGGSGPGGPGSGAAGASGPGSGAAGAEGPGSGGTGPAGPGGAGPGPGSGGAGVCDGTGVCEDSDQIETNDCLACALPGPCAAIVDQCGNEQNCALFLICMQQCGGTAACVDECKTSAPDGFAGYQQLAGCLCNACPTDCANSGNICLE